MYRFMKFNNGLGRYALVVALALAGGWAAVASVPLSQIVAPYVASGGQGSDCPGPFTAYSIMTNSTGSVWITPPAGTTNGILTDLSSFPAPYASVASVMRKSDLMTWCAGNYVEFPVTNGDKFQLKVFVISAVPTNTPLALTLQIAWH
jgi:hypothetical protein